VRCNSRRARPRGRHFFGAALLAYYSFVGLETSANVIEEVKDPSRVYPRALSGAIALVAVANGALLTMTMSSRLAYGMAKQNLIPRAFSRVFPHRGTPWVTTVITTAVAMALTVSGSIATLAETVVLLLLYVFLSITVAVLVQRRDATNTTDFRAWTVLPVLGAASCVVLLTQQSIEVWLRGGIIVAVGVGLFAIMALSRGRR